jgi:hypothetical protein
MNIRQLDPKNLAKNEDWDGFVIAVTCPVCEKVYVVSGHSHRQGRPCPGCGKSQAFVRKESGQEGTASIRWEE